MSEIRLDHDAWVVVADGEKALFLRNEGDVRHPNLQVFREMAEDNPPTREQGVDQPGRFNSGASPHRSALEETDWQRIGKERFAKHVVERLYKSAHRGDFDKIVIVAPPLVLGEMRKEMHKAVADRVIGEVPKTLTNHTIEDIEKLLTED
ncbi:host attachment family protein [Aquamicrobium zhengzhouense]|uniref:Host attachment protein n=1 Tax=Aquamicrobium zhengzhouense TaxID=2781738 RepID=A0ABS0SF39_9HYPH|nr:host attachment family protein [Aquamicrobium zhengzhouense]MBI1621903.1 host attachment protein [Aquamicrobium zhengzhouense]